MRHNSATLDTSTDVIKVTNYTVLWDPKLAWYSLSATHRNYFHVLEYGLRIPCPTWPCLIAKVLATPDYCTVINYDITVHTTNVFSCFHCSLNSKSISSQIRLRCMSICVSSKEIHSVSVHQIPIAMSTSCGFNCFSHMIYTLKTNMYYQNIAKLLTHPSVKVTIWYPKELPILLCKLKYNVSCQLK